MRRLIGFCAALAFAAGTAHAATTSFVISGHDADDPTTNIFGGAAGGVSHVIAEGGAQYTIGFASTPSPTVTLSAAAGSSLTSFNADFLYTIGISFSSPITSTSCFFGQSCTTPPVPIGSATGKLAIDGVGGVAYAIANAGSHRFDGDGVGDGCFDGVVCRLNHSYTADLFLDRTTTGGVVGSIGELVAYTFFVPLDLNLQGHLPGDGVSRYTLSIDPVITLNPVFFSTYGIDPTTAHLSFEPGIGNAVSGTPEPSSWVLLIAGFAVVGSAARRRRTSGAETVAA